MNARMLLILAVAGVAGYVLYKNVLSSRAPLTAPAQNNPQHGMAPPANNQDLFSQILGAATAIANTVGAFAQSGSKQN